MSLRPLLLACFCIVGCAHEWDVYDKDAASDAQLGIIDGGALPGEDARTGSWNIAPGPDASDPCANTSQCTAAPSSTCVQKNECGGCGALEHAPGSPCDGDDADSCNDGVWQCSGTAVVCNDGAALGTPQPEVCDGIDNDCNGMVDDTIQSFSPALTLASVTGTLWDTEIGVSPPNSAAAGGYLITYVIGSETDRKGQLMGLRVSADGKAIGAPFQISAQSANKTAVIWHENAWTVLYTTDLDSAGHGSTLSMVTVNPGTGAVGMRRILGNGPTVSNFSVAGSSPPVVTWIQNSSLWATTLTATPQPKTLLPGGTGGTMYMHSEVAVVEEGKEWGIRLDVWLIDAANNSTFPVHYLTVDKNLTITKNTRLFAPPDGHYPLDLLYLPSTQQLVGHLYQNGKTHLATHRRDATDYKMSEVGLATLLADGSGYAKLTLSGIQRYSASGELLENTGNLSGTFGDYYEYFGGTPGSQGSTTRFAVAGILSGKLNLYLMGCTK